MDLRMLYSIYLFAGYNILRQTTYCLDGLIIEQMADVYDVLGRICVDKMMVLSTKYGSV
jgi:hypothetical protein